MGRLVLREIHGYICPILWRKTLRTLSCNAAYEREWFGRSPLAMKQDAERNLCLVKAQ